MSPRPVSSTFGHKPIKKSLPKRAATISESLTGLTPEQLAEHQRELRRDREQRVQEIQEVRP